MPLPNMAQHCISIIFYIFCNSEMYVKLHVFYITHNVQIDLFDVILETKAGTTKETDKYFEVKKNDGNIPAVPEKAVI